MKSIIETILEFVLGAIIIMIISYMFDSVYVKDFTVALLVAVVLAILNKLIKPILTVLAFPITLMTLGIFQLIVNGFILKLATMILAPDFQISSFFMMIVTSICISIMSGIVGIKND